MPQATLLNLFIQFGLAGLVGFLIGLEREMRVTKNRSYSGARDFTLFSLIGAVSAFTANHYENSWIIVAGLMGVMTLMIFGYWAEHSQNLEKGPGITTETSALLTFFLGVLIVNEAIEIAIALAIATLGILSQKQAVKTFRTQIHSYELRAVLKFLIITFIVLPVLPNQSLNTYLSTEVGTVVSIDKQRQIIEISAKNTDSIAPGHKLEIEDRKGFPLGAATVTRIQDNTLFARYEGGDIGQVTTSENVRKYRINIKFINTMLAALQPYKIWLIVVLVSFISFIGYVLIKIIGSSLGIGLTGLIGGLVSSTVTTLSFSRRSKETPEWNENFAVAVILASAVMFPRLWLEIAIVNQELMKTITLPLMVLGFAGLGLAGFHFFHSRRHQVTSQEVSFENPFSLKSAINFALIFSVILMVTRLATTYLSDAWLPVVAILSGLTDADAIAFSLSDAQQAGTISIDWASLNLVLGALSNTFMKLFLVLALGHRGLFKHLLVSFCIMGLLGALTIFFYYNFISSSGIWAILSAPA